MNLVEIVVTVTLDTDTNHCGAEKAIIFAATNLIDSIEV